MYCFLVAALCVGTRGVELGVKVGLITQGPNEIKMLFLFYFFFISKSLVS